MQPEKITALRRRFHAHAEPGFLEYRTASVILAELAARGVPATTGAGAIDVGRIAVPPTPTEKDEWGRRAVAAGAPSADVAYFQEHGTAIIAELEGNRDGPTWGLRVDIDALPVDEETAADHAPVAGGYRSTTPFMHACGHDGHAAIGIALADRLRDGNFPGRVRILFQPAEEGVRGAQPMIDAGVTRGVDRMLAVHLGGDLPTGTVVGGVTDAMATTKWRATFEGEAAHAAASPEKGRHALAAAAQATLAILGLPRFAEADTRVNVGTFHADGSANIIPALATITYETRSTSNAVLDDLDRRAEAAVQGAAGMYGVTATTKAYGRAAVSLPDDALLDDVARAARGVPAITAYTPSGASGGGSDDAHLLIREVQESGGLGTYIFVGASNPAPHHHRRFDIDEDALVIAVDLLEALFRG
ncbi:amidohydrolase [Arthrobacter agilis]|uniref:Amidohydrolase n=1 Tax=Arthrobacter agilis TaxID=37921 RepID=A0A2L0UFB8_9MICC|nr:amidohydrolase [Arthrobacter agilis]AUZ87916.1 amidohydrolase [Arthrobacter agilis]